MKRTLDLSDDMVSKPISSNSVIGLALHTCLQNGPGY